MVGIPRIGLGTWQNTDPEKCANTVETALDIGYRHLDTAQIYRNEEYVGRGLQRSNIDREKVFLASKVWRSNLSPEKVKSSTRESLEKLGVDKIDLMYIHWPSGNYQPRKTLEAFKELVEEDKIESIGVSNFGPEQLDQAMQIAGDHIVANQVEMHPLYQQEETLKKCREHDIALVAYSPLARGKVMEIPEIQEIAEKHDASEAQVSIAWLLQKQGVVAIPKASTRKHLEDNFAAMDLELDEEDIEKIDSIEKEEKLVQL